jgi:CubicO group peptidase (beta-lactamase class C family)
VTTTLDDRWPGFPAYVVFRMRDGRVERVAEAGDLEDVRPWASVSKMAVGLAFGVECDWDMHEYSETVGPRGANIANLLSHSSGLGLEEVDPFVDVGTKRIYSNVGIDYVVDAIMQDGTPQSWLNHRVFSGLGMDSTSLQGRPSSGVEGSTNDLATLAIAWLVPEVISRETRDRIIKPYMPELNGIVPGFGRFSPCPWGLGPEVRGHKEHWMGDWPATSFGHFGQSGALMLLNADEGIGVVATSTEPFGGWAVELWPEWTSAQRKIALAL